MVFVGIAAGLAWYLLFEDHGEREPIGALWLAVGFGVLGAILAMFLEKSLPSIHNGAHMPVSKLALTTLAIGVIEEACKFMPLAVYIYKKRYFNENTDGVVYFALAGLGFGLPENILYTAHFGTVAGFTRLALTPFFHAAATGLIGYFLIKYKMLGRSPYWVVLPLVSMMVIHAFYDFGLSSGLMPFMILSVFITLNLSAAIFIFFVRAKEKDEDLGISAIGNNSFCRTCGNPNPHHHLYCTQCGNNA